LTARLAERVRRAVRGGVSERRVVHFLAQKANVRGEVEITLSEVALEVARDVRTVRRAVHNLVATGALVVTPCPGSTSLFTVVDPGLQRKKAEKPQPVGVLSNPSPQADNPGHTPDPPRHLLPPVKRVKTRARAGGFTTTWNAHCGALPQLRTTPTSPDAVALIESALDATGDDLALLGRAIARAASDELYQQRRFGFETFCRHIDRWLDDRGVTSAPARRPRLIEATAPVDLEAQARYAREVGDQLRSRRTTTEATA
jgi:hypothetical protein